jgi:hypothetical protein
VTRARTIASRLAETKTANYALRAEHESLLAECRRSAAELREAVIEYTRELRRAGVPADRALQMIQDAMRSDAGGPLPDVILGREFDDAVEWCLQAYYAA